MGSIEEWEAQSRAVALTNRQWSDLTCYLLLSSQSMEKAAYDWARRAQETDEHGNAKYPNAADNAEFQWELNASVEAIRKIIDRTD